ncbi:MAG TPA: glycoside hydrolase family 2 TIM barrel-domain containing protein [Candidatus Saccharimonadales bacterium]|nr:glycoside hydrolase family 2 TIM barrel-domain containing protein [Candidatus Saccharimonadales bacterium]
MRTTTISLDGPDWQVRGFLGLEAALAAAARIDASGDGWLPARVPGSVVDDLWQAGDVPDPYHERATRSLEWVATRAWLYRRSWDRPKLRGGERAWLRFDGVDHAAHVFVDGVPVARHEGMFTPFEVDLTEPLLERASAPAAPIALAVVIEPAPDVEPQVGRTSRVRVHKSRMGYGWDFCPRLIHQGIWQSVTAIVGAVRIVDVWARPRLSDDLADAAVGVEVTVDAPSDGVQVELQLTDPDEAIVATGAVATQRVGPRSAAHAELGIRRPALWWPNGLGRPAIHRLTVRATDHDGNVDETTVPVGFRTVHLRANPGAPAGARGYSFEVNGRPMYVNGWNWVPTDTMYGVPRPERLAHLLRLAASSGANLLRVWGGGLIETAAFYDTCDRLGLLVWQEFAQSSSGLESRPAEDDAFVQLMTREAEQIVPLRRNHPSLAVWCGGNELQGPDGPLDDGAPVLGALRGVVERLDPDRAWLPTSPSGPRFANTVESIAADPDGLHDVHGPWEHQGLDRHHALYDAGTSLFHSEFGVEGMTNRRSHARLIEPEHRWPATRANAVYRHLGDWWINEPLVQASFGGRLTDLESLRRGSQWLQAEGLRYAVEADRRRAPRQSGAIPWQLNESYPNAWCTSVVDHRGDPKPAFHAVARTYRPTVICAEIDAPVLGGRSAWAVSVWAWSTTGALREAVVRRRLVALDGRIVDEVLGSARFADERPVELLPRDDLRPAAGEALLMLDLRLESPDGDVAAGARYLLSSGDDLAALLDMPSATVEATAVVDPATPDRWLVRLVHRGGPTAVGVRIEDDRPIECAGWAEVEDGGFHLLPGEHRALAVDWADAASAGRRLVTSGWNVAPLVLTADVVRGPEPVPLAGTRP